MKAAVIEKYGAPDVVKISEVERPVPKENEILIKVNSATINRTDCGFRQPSPFFLRFFTGLFRPRIKILGTEFAGEVVETGGNMKEFKSGDKVFGLSCSGFGAHAEYLSIPEDGAVALMPVNMNFNEAAAVCDGLMLAYNYLRIPDYSKGIKILIYGATGSIGSAGVQLAKYFGADITAVCNTKNLDLIKSLGADRVLDYTKSDFKLHAGQYDVVFDAVGKLSFTKCKHLIKRGGIFFTTDLGEHNQVPFQVLWTSFFGDKKVLFPLPKESKKDILFFKKIIEEGNYKAVIDRIYPLEKIAEAYEYVDTEQKTGNVVLSIAGEIRA